MGRIRNAVDRAKLRYWFIIVVASFSGCQSADPLAVFGPYKVPPPSTTQTAPYYPPSGATAQQVEKTPPPRLSVSAETPSLLKTPARVATDPTDRQPIRVVENPTAATRTAAAANRGATPAGEANVSAPSTATAK